jgi:hypothetical protein
LSFGVSPKNRRICLIPGLTSGDIQPPYALDMRHQLISTLTLVIACLVAVILFASLVSATPKLPDSETSFEIPSEDEIYKYYLGLSDDTETIKDGLSEAFAQAVQEAIRENYGFVTQINSDSYVTDRENQILKNLKQQSGEISLNGFEKIDSKASLNAKTSRYQVRVLYRYNKTAINAELARIKSGSHTPGPAVSKVGLIDNQDLGGIQVNTEPPQASLYLNDEPYLRSPIEIINQIQPGKYRLKIDHPYYETIEQDVFIRANEVTKISKTLVPAKGKFSLESAPTGAKVKIDGVLIGKTPITDFKLTAGIPVRIDIEHVDAYPMSLYSFAVDKDQHRVETLDLKMKPGSIIISNNVHDPKINVEIKIDGEKQPHRKRLFRLPAGSHSFEATAIGYTSSTKTIEVKANKTISEKIDLEKEQPISMPSADNRSSPWVKPMYVESSSYYLTAIVSAELLTNPIASKVTSATSSSAYSSFMNASYLVELALGFRTGVGLAYSRGILGKSEGPSPVDSDGYYISTANRKKIGINLNFLDQTGNTMQLGFESETLDAEVTHNLYNALTATSIKVRSTASISGDSIYGTWLVRKDKALINFKLGVTNYSVQDKNIKGSQSIYFGIGIGVDFLSPAGGR